MKHSVAPALATIILAGVAACSGGPTGGTSTGPSAELPPAVSKSEQSPHFTYYPGKYGSGGAAPVVMSSLTVNSHGNQFYFFDQNYDWIGMTGGVFTQLPFQHYATPQGMAQQSNGYSAFAYSNRGNTLYGLAELEASPNTAYLVVNPYSPSKARLIPLGPYSGIAEFNDIEADPDGRILIAGSNGLIAVSDAGGKPSVATYSPSTAPGFWRVTVAANKDIYASTIGDFSHVYQLSPTLTLRRIIGDNATHTDSLTPDPSGGIWFSDSSRGTFGRILTDGSVKTYTPSFVAQDVATSKDGSVWVVGYNPTAQTGAVVARVEPNGTTLQYTVTTPGSRYASGYFRGTYGVAGARDALYSLDPAGDIITVSL